MRFQCVKFLCPKIGLCKFFDKYQVWLPPASAEACRPCAGCSSPPWSPAPLCSCWSPWSCSTTPGLSWSSPVWQVVVGDNERWWQLFNDYHQNQSQILNQKKMYNHRQSVDLPVSITLLLAVFVFLISRTDRIKVFRPHFDRALDVFPFLLLLWRHGGLQKTIPEMFVKKLGIGRKHRNAGGQQCSW